MKINEDTGKVIRTEMYRWGYTLERLSQETEISKAVLQGILTGRAQSISTRNLCALARTFGYGAAEFTDLISGKP